MSKTQACVRLSSLRTRRIHGQRGFALVAILIIITLIAIIGLSMASGGVLQERMSGATRDHQVAFQAAELALRDAEQAIEADANSDMGFDDVCTAGRCLPLADRPTGAQSEQRWRTIDWSTQTLVYGSVTGAPALVGPDSTPLAKQPRYFIERLPTLPSVPGSSSCTGVGCSPSGDPPARGFRITARGYGLRGSTQVTLQSVYVKA